MQSFLDTLVGSLHLDAPDGADGGGGSGGGNAPLGTVPSGGGASNISAEPQPIELDDNSVIRIKGSDKTVPFKDVRGFQAQFTKASQEAARLKQELQNERITRQKYESEMQKLRSAQPQAGQAPDVYDALRKLPYVTGEDAVGMVQGIAQSIQQRDQVLLATLKQLQQMQQLVNGLQQNHTSSTFETKITGWLKDGGYDPGYADLAKEIYLAYEGDDLDTEFPQIFANRVKQIETLIATKKAASLAQNRRSPFVPGKGGQAGPSKPLEIKANATAKEVADLLWQDFSGGNGT